MRQFRQWSPPTRLGTRINVALIKAEVDKGAARDLHSEVMEHPPAGKPPLDFRIPERQKVEFSGQKKPKESGRAPSEASVFKISKFKSIDEAEKGAAKDLHNKVMRLNPAGPPPVDLRLPQRKKITFSAPKEKEEKLVSKSAMDLLDEMLSKAEPKITVVRRMPGGEEKHLAGPKMTSPSTAAPKTPAMKPSTVAPKPAAPKPSTAAPKAAAPKAAPPTAAAKPAPVAPSSTQVSAPKLDTNVSLAPSTASGSIDVPSKTAPGVTSEPKVMLSPEISPKTSAPKPSTAAAKPKWEVPGGPGWTYDPPDPPEVSASGSGGSKKPEASSTKLQASSTKPKGKEKLSPISSAAGIGFAEGSFIGAETGGSKTGGTAAMQVGATEGVQTLFGGGGGSGTGGYVSSQRTTPSGFAPQRQAFTGKKGQGGQTAIGRATQSAMKSFMGIPRGIPGTRTIVGR